MAQSTDILTDIADDELPELLELYMQHEYDTPLACNVIRNGIKWKKKNKNLEFYIVSPNNCWRKDGTFLVLIQFTSNILFFYTLDKSCKMLYEGLTQSNRLRNGRPVLLYAIYDDFNETVLKIIAERNLENNDIPSNLMYISKENAIEMNTECPPEVYCKKIDKSHVPTINSVWPHKYPGSEKFLETVISMNDGYGLFLKSTDELVSWMLVGILGQLASLQTMEKHKNKGYGSLITQIVSKEMAKDGLHPVGTVIIVNEPSQKMFRKLGFTSFGITHYLDLKF